MWPSNEMFFLLTFNCFSNLRSFTLPLVNIYTHHKLWQILVLPPIVVFRGIYHYRSIAHTFSFLSLTQNFESNLLNLFFTESINFFRVTTYSVPSSISVFYIPSLPCLAHVLDATGVYCVVWPPLGRWRGINHSKWVICLCKLKK